MSLKIRNELRMMIWKIEMQIAHLSRFYDIAAGDIVMTGTPAGVGPVLKGDILQANIERLGSIEVKVV